LDGTLVTPPPTPDAYEDAQPIEKTVAIARELHAAGHTVVVGAGKECEISNFGGSYLGRFPLVSANFWTSDHLSERSRRVDVFPGTRARGTPTLKRR
jgi:hypothetical protein